jgi:hypothetical protein
MEFLVFIIPPKNGGANGLYFFLSRVSLENTYPATLVTVKISYINLTGRGRGGGRRRRRQGGRRETTMEVVFIFYGVVAVLVGFVDTLSYPILSYLSLRISLHAGTP